MSNRYFGPHIKGFVEDKAIPLRSKIITIAIMAIYDHYFPLLVGYWWVKALLGLICIGVSWHILSYPTKKNEITCSSIGLLGLSLFIAFYRSLTTLSVFFQGLFQADS